MPLVKFSKKQQTKKLHKKNADSISLLISTQLNEVDRLIEKVQGKVLEVWHSFYAELDHKNTLKTQLRKINYSHIKQYVNENRDHLPLDTFELKRFMSTVYLHLPSHFYLDKFFCLGEKIEDTYGRNSELLFALSDILINLNACRKSLVELQTQKTGKTKKMGARRMNEITNKLAEIQLELNSIETKLDNLRIKAPEETPLQM